MDSDRPYIFCHMMTSLDGKIMGNFIAQPDFGMFYVSVDPSGRIGWKKNTLTYGDTTAHIIEVLTEKASNAYKALLRKLEVSYILAGRDV